MAALNFLRNIFMRLTALVLLLLTAPILFILYLLIKLDDGGPFVFTQKRTGLNKKPFTLYKIRSMTVNSENKQYLYQHLNEADGPVFKIYNDPRLTRIGSFLFHTGLDELLQLINILKGEMSFIGPRPLPIAEAKKIPKKYEKRFSVLPGITSVWVINGSHKLSFKEWMELDLYYVENKSLTMDGRITLSTALLIIKYIVKSLKETVLNLSLVK
jgi:lipopolysaccharide/colanic/teichoic acid biosynthesis glycosyltransferase